jgi:hypothetical protein
MSVERVRVLRACCVGFALSESERIGVLEAFYESLPSMSSLKSNKYGKAENIGLQSEGVLAVEFGAPWATGTQGRGGKSTKP